MIPEIQQRICVIETAIKELGFLVQSLQENLNELRHQIGVEPQPKCSMQTKDCESLTSAGRTSRY